MDIDNINRRSFLKKSAVSAVAVETAITSSAVASQKEGDSSGGGGGGSSTATWDVPIISTRGHFYIDTDCGWFGICGFSEHLEDGHTEYDYDVPAESPPIPWDEDEVVIYCHGYNSDTMEEGVSGAAEVQANFYEFSTETIDYDGGFVGYTWDSAVTPGPEVFGIAYSDQERIGRRNGKKAANFITDLQDAGSTDTTVHWVAHSMGGQVTFGLVDELYRLGRSIDSIMLWGAAVPREWPNLSNYGYKIEEVCREFDAIHSHNDAILEDAYKIETGNDALGARGAKGTEPCNYEDHDLSYLFMGHSEYHNTAIEGYWAAGETILEFRNPDFDGIAQCDSSGSGGGGGGGGGGVGSTITTYGA